MLKVRALKLTNHRHIDAQAITFCVSGGQLLWVRGENGAGKTTLLQTLLNITPHDAGDIDWANPKPEIFYLGHDLALKPYLSVLEFCSWHPAVGLVDQKSIIQALTDVSLLEAAHQFTGQLSRGQQQRLLIACAILSQRALWLLDEPLTALDPKSQTIIAACMNTQKTRGGALVVVSHADISTIADEVLHVQ